MTKGTNVIRLSDTQNKLFSVLCEEAANNPGNSLGWHELFSHSWGQEPKPDKRPLFDACWRKLKDKLRALGEAAMFHNEPGAGYWLEPEGGINPVPEEQDPAQASNSALRLSEEQRSLCLDDDGGRVENGAQCVSYGRSPLELGPVYAWIMIRNILHGNVQHDVITVADPSSLVALFRSILNQICRYAGEEGEAPERVALCVAARLRIAAARHLFGPSQYVVNVSNARTAAAYIAPLHAPMTAVLLTLPELKEFADYCNRLQWDGGVLSFDSSVVDRSFRRQEFLGLLEQLCVTNPVWLTLVSILLPDPKQSTMLFKVGS